MIKKSNLSPGLSPEWEEEVEVSPRTLNLKKKQVEFERKKASGELEVELDVKDPKKSKESHFLRWVILALVAAGLGLLVFLFDLL